MDQHSIPRQITTFEFKLIGFMTLRQFMYLIVFFPAAAVVYFLFPVPILNFIFAALIGLLGVFFAFFPIYDRPLDVWVKNLFKRLTRPTQFVFRKQNPPIYYLGDLFFVGDPHRTASHVESQEKLAAYLESVKKTNHADDGEKKKKTISAVAKPTPALSVSISTTPTPTKKQPFFTGVVKNHKLMPLPGVLIYVKNQNDQVLRLMKTNMYGVFASFNPLPGDEYFFETKDPTSRHFFDKMKIAIEPVNPKPIEIFSRETI